jgi:hypothetical protein
MDDFMKQENCHINHDFEQAIRKLSQEVIAMGDLALLNFERSMRFHPFAERIGELAVSRGEDTGCFASAKDIRHLKAETNKPSSLSKSEQSYTVSQKFLRK